jgi:hypothetical protein
MKKTSEYDKFDQAMCELMKVPHSEIKAKLDAEKIAKAKKGKSKSSQKAEAHT